MKKEKKTLAISGMHCTACALNIERALKEEKGIIEANVNFASEKASLTFDSQKISLKQIKKLVQGTGYQVVEGRQQQKEEEK